jgi:hypothetical protein
VYFDEKIAWAQATGEGKKMRIKIHRDVNGNSRSGRFSSFD